MVNVRTREGGEKYHGAISYKTDHLGNAESNFIFNTDILEANLNGPEPITSFLLPALGLKIPGDLTFFGNFYGGLTDGIAQGYIKRKQIKFTPLYSKALILHQEQKITGSGWVN